MLKSRLLPRAALGGALNFSKSCVPKNFMKYFGEEGGVGVTVYRYYPTAIQLQLMPLDNAGL